MQQKLKDFIELVDQQINEYNYGNHPEELYDPIRYLLSLGGKRLRPLLTMLAYSISKKDPKSIARYAASIEVFHNFTLMHDDIMDNAPLRRNEVTVHEKWNDNVAILSGDVMLVKAYDMLLESESPRIKEIIKKFNVCAREVCEGQMLDMNFEERNDVKEEEYLEMIRLKTAVLLGFSLELGAILANEDTQQCETLQSIGQNIGIGFQLKDDLLDVYADQSKFGKQVGGDIIANKKTYLLIKAMQIAQGKHKEDLQSWIDRKEFDPKEKVESVRNIYDQLGVKEITENLMNTYFHKGIQAIDQLKGDQEYLSLLRSFFQELINREK